MFPGGADGCAHFHPDVFGRFSGDNEITILKSSGISIYRIISPPFIFAAVITVAMIIFNDKVLPISITGPGPWWPISGKKSHFETEPGIFFNVDRLFPSTLKKWIKTLGEELSDRTITGRSMKWKPGRINCSHFDFWSQAIVPDRYHHRRRRVMVYPGS